MQKSAMKIASARTIHSTINVSRAVLLQSAYAYAVTRNTGRFKKYVGVGKLGERAIGGHRSARKVRKCRVIRKYDCQGADDATSRRSFPARGGLVIFESSYTYDHADA